MENEEKKSEQGMIEKAKNAIINAVDENGNGEIDIEDVIIKGLRIPGIKINRDEFLRKQLLKLYPHAEGESSGCAKKKRQGCVTLPLSVCAGIGDQISRQTMECFAEFFEVLVLQNFAGTVFYAQKCCVRNTCEACETTAAAAFAFE